MYGIFLCLLFSDTPYSFSSTHALFCLTLNATDDKAWNGQKSWYHIGYTSDLDNGEMLNPVITNTTNTVQSADSYFSNGIENFYMKTDADVGRGLGGA